MVTIISRQTWGAVPANRTIYTIAANRRTGFVVHHSVSGTGLNMAGAMALIRSFQRLHQANGWGDIGYNFLIDAFGNVYEGRGLNAIGAHAGNHNTNNLGVCYIGDGRTGEMPEPAKQAFRNLYAWANRQTGKTLTQLVHSDLNSTACPGPFIRNWVKAGSLNPVSVSPTSNTVNQEEDERMKIIAPFGGDARAVIGPGIGRAFGDYSSYLHFCNVWGFNPENAQVVGDAGFGKEGALALFYEIIAMHTPPAAPGQLSAASVTAAVASALAGASIPATVDVAAIVRAVEASLADDFARVNANVDEIPLGFTITAK